MPAEPAQIEPVLGYRFANPELLRRALTHSSWVHETPDEVSATLRHNEQFEFLGDAVLGFCVSDALVAKFSEWPEGSLHRLKAHLVSAAHLAGVAARLRLGDYMVMGRGEELSGGRAKPALLVNAVEALIAALYLDGGIDPARAFIAHWVIAETLESPETTIPAEHTDFISALLHLMRSRKLPAPQFVVVQERGPEHAKLFILEARMGRTVLGRGEGRSKKAASQKAAEQAMLTLNEEPPGI
jgi:ribonuclease-3